MPTPKTSGNCYICGKMLGKTAIKNHIVKEHTADGDEECLLLKIEGDDAKEYWLYADVSKKAPLRALDEFMREIWLECCGHMSMFHTGHYDEVSKSRKWETFAVGGKLLHDYDMGSTTRCRVTVVGESRRPKQKKAVRLLARNVPPVLTCAACGEPAECICQECMYDADKNPHYCKGCAEKHEHDMMIAITNSPRYGECGYNGELDTYTFDAGKITG